MGVVESVALTVSGIIIMVVVIMQVVSSRVVSCLLGLFIGVPFLVAYRLYGVQLLGAYI